MEPSPFRLLFDSKAVIDDLATRIRVTVIMADQKPNESSTFFRGDFSFVNKDAKTINHKDHEGTVSWHVMNRYQRWKKQQSAKSLYQSANLPVSRRSTRTPRHVNQVQQEQSVEKGLWRPYFPESTADMAEKLNDYDSWEIDQELEDGFLAQEPPVGIISCIQDSAPSALPWTVEDLCSISSDSLAAVETAETIQQPCSPGGATGHLSNKLETMVDNPAAARAHLKFLKTSIAAQGGILLLDPSFREDLLSCDCYVALRCRTRPVFPVHEWTPGPLSQPWKARLISDGRLGSVTEIDPTIKDLVLKSILIDLKELFKAHEYILHQDLRPDSQLLRWKQLRRLDCISRLGNHNVDLAIYPHLYEKPTIQFSVTSAASLLANMVLGSLNSANLGLELLNELRTKFTESQVELENGTEQRLQLWILHVGSLAESMYPVTEADQLWFTSRLNKLASALGLCRWSEMKNILGKFLFCECLHQEVANDRACPDTTRKTSFMSSDCGTSLELPAFHKDWACTSGKVPT